MFLATRTEEDVQLLVISNPPARIIATALVLADPVVTLLPHYSLQLFNCLI